MGFFRAETGTPPSFPTRCPRRRSVPVRCEALFRSRSFLSLFRRQLPGILSRGGSEGGSAGFFLSSWVSARFRLDLQVVSPHAFWGCFHHGETCRFSLETQFWSFLMSKQITQAGSSKATRSNKATRGNPSVTHPFQNKQSYVFGIHIYIYIIYIYIYIFHTYMHTHAYIYIYILLIFP